jgi:hypothetical protein
MLTPTVRVRRSLVTSRLHAHAAGRMKQHIFNGSVQDKAESNLSGH